MRPKSRSADVVYHSDGVGRFMALRPSPKPGELTSMLVDICKLHPRYRGKGKPRRRRGGPAECRECMKIWRKVKPPKKEKRNIVQRHHITYEPEVTVLIRQTEHYALTCIQRIGRPYSRGFIQSLAAVVALHGPAAEEVVRDPLTVEVAIP